MAFTFIGAYWRDRPETRSQCAERYARLLACLRDYPYLAQWFFQERSAKNAPRPVPIHANDLEGYLETNKGDFDHAPIVELGFSLTIWNGGDDETAAKLSVKCGSYDSPVPNSVVLNMPDCKQAVAGFWDEYRSLLRDIIDCFDPDEGVVTSTERIKRYTRETWVHSGYLNYKRGGEITEGHPD